MTEKEFTQHVIDGMKNYQPKNDTSELVGYYHGILHILTDVAYFADLNKVDWALVKEEAEKMYKNLTCHNE